MGFPNIDFPRLQQKCRQYHKILCLPKFWWRIALNLYLKKEVVIEKNKLFQTDYISPPPLFLQIFSNSSFSYLQNRFDSNQKIYASQGNNSEWRHFHQNTYFSWWRILINFKSLIIISTVLDTNFYMFHQKKEWAF